MPKTKKRYLILFNVMNKNDRKYTQESFHEIPNPCMVQLNWPGDRVNLNEVCAICKLGIDDIGLYAYDFKFLRNGLTPNNELVENARLVIRYLKAGIVKTLVTASTGSIDPDGTVNSCIIVCLFFTDEPSFDLNQ